MSTNTNVGSTAQARAILFVSFAGISLLANATLTFLFGHAFLGGTLGAILLLLFFDGAAISWFTVRNSSGLSGAQRATAKIVSVMTICGSTLISVFQVLMMRDAVMVQDSLASTTATWLVTTFAALNFLAIFYFQYTSIRERDLEENEELSAKKADKMAEMKRAAHEKALEMANDLLMAETPAMAKQLADEVNRDFRQLMGAAAGAKQVGKAEPGQTIVKRLNGSKQPSEETTENPETPGKP